MPINAVINFLVASALGFLAGIGVGGGSLLILWLTLVADMAPDSARTLNLLFFIPSALISTIFRWRQGDVKARNTLPAIIGGCISAAIFSSLSYHINTGSLKKLFGLLLIVTGIRELLYKKKKQD